MLSHLDKQFNQLYLKGAEDGQKRLITFMFLIMKKVITVDELEITKGSGITADDLKKLRAVIDRLKVR